MELAPVLPFVAPLVVTILFCLTLYQRYHRRLSNNLVFAPLAPDHGRRPALLIIVPDRKRRAAEYSALARCLQQHSSLNLWVGVVHGTRNIFLKSLEINARIVSLIARVRGSGFGVIQPGDIFVAGHGEGGEIASDLVVQHKFCGLVLLGSTIRSSRGWFRLPGGLNRHPTPVLTLGGELDGITRITRIALSFRSFQRARQRSNDPSVVFSKPVIVLRGVNHGQFANGRHCRSDMKPEVTLSQAHDEIAGVVDAFLSLNLDPSLAPSAAVESISTGLRTTEGLVEPFLAALAQDRLWCQDLQRVFANLNPQDNERIKCHDTLHRNRSTFMYQKPKITAVALPNEATRLFYVQTHSYLIEDTRDALVASVATKEIALKIKSQAALCKELNKTCLELPPERSAGNVNAQAMQWALDHVPSRMRERYLLRGKQLDFGPDQVIKVGPTWLQEELRFVPSETSDNRVQVVSPVMRGGASVMLPRYSEMQYMKLLSPARAMEWIMVDSLIEDGPLEIPSKLSELYQWMTMMVLGHQLLPEARLALQSNDDVHYSLARVKYAHGFFPISPGSSTTAIVLLPGALVSPEAYAPLARSIAAEGYTAFVVSAPFRTSTLALARTKRLIQAYPEYKRWAIGGHGIGGLASCQFVQRFPDLVDGLFLMSSYPSSSIDLSDYIDLSVAVVYGTNEFAKEGIESKDARDRLPRATRYVPIAGANREQFGYYVGQAVDAPATVSRADQHAIAKHVALELLASL